MDQGTITRVKRGYVWIDCAQGEECVDLHDLRPRDGATGLAKWNIPL